MPSKKIFSVILFCSLLVFGLFLVSVSISVGSNVAPQTVAAADINPESRALVQNSQHVIFQAEPTLPDVVTQEPAPTDIVAITEVPPPTNVPVPTQDPNDPAQNPAAPGGVLTNLLTSVVSFVVGALITFVGMLKVFTMLKDNKSAENTIEQLVTALQNSFPATPIKSTLNQVGAGLQDAGQVLKDVTDGKME